MKYWASIRCRCWEEGTIRPTPFPREQWEIDATGYLRLRPLFETEDSFHEARRWMRTCCEHPAMVLVETPFSRDGRWNGFRAFLHNCCGAGNFPALVESLPQSEESIVSPPSSEAALGELRRFLERKDSADAAVVCDSQSGDALHYSFSERPESGISPMGLIHLSLDARGLRVSDRHQDKTLFESSHFRQYSPSGCRTDHAKDIVWQDVESGHLFQIGSAIFYDTEKDGYPEELCVDARSICSSEFGEIVGKLQGLFAASVSIGNPVRWYSK